MAVLYIMELSTLGVPSEGGNMQVAKVPPVTEQTVTIGGSSTPSNAFNTETRFVRLETDTTCCIAWGPNPTAVAGTNMRLYANSAEYFAVTPGYKLAVVSSA